MHKKQAFRYTKRLDAMANDVQKNWQEYGLTKQAAYDFCLQVDKMSDRIDEIAGIDRQSEEHMDHRDEFDEAGEHPAKTDQREFMDRQEPDEPYMEHYDMEGVLEGLDPEDDYMEEFDHSESAGFKDGPLDGDDPLDEHKRRQHASTNSGGNWYNRSATGRKSSRSNSSNWYDGTSSSKTASSGQSWYDQSSNSGNWYNQ